MFQANHFESCLVLALFSDPLGGPSSAAGGENMKFL